MTTAKYLTRCVATGGIESATVKKFAAQGVLTGVVVRADRWAFETVGLASPSKSTTQWWAYLPFAEGAVQAATGSAQCAADKRLLDSGVHQALIDQYEFAKNKYRLKIKGFEGADKAKQLILEAYNRAKK